MTESAFGEATRSTRNRCTGFLALMVPELSIPYFGELAGPVITAAQKRGWSVLHCGPRRRSSRSLRERVRDRLDANR